MSNINYGRAVVVAPLIKVTRLVPKPLTLATLKALVLADRKSRSGEGGAK